ADRADPPAGRRIARRRARDARSRARARRAQGRRLAAARRGRRPRPPRRSAGLRAGPRRTGWARAGARGHGDALSAAAARPRAAEVPPHRAHGHPCSSGTPRCDLIGYGGRVVTASMTTPESSRIEPEDPSITETTASELAPLYRQMLAIRRMEEAAA